MDRPAGHSPNMVLCMSGEIWVPSKGEANEHDPALSMWSAKHMMGATSENPLGYLLRHLLLIYRKGKSTGLDVFDIYLSD